MPNTTLNIPVIVKTTPIEGVVNYHLRPLFFYHPIATHRRYEQAVNQFKKELKHFYRGFVLHRKNAHQLLWYMFNPKTEYQQFILSLSINKQSIQGRFGVATFEMHGHHFACLPSLNNFMFMLTPDKKGKINIKEQVKRVAQSLLNDYKKDLKNEFDIKQYFSDRKEFLISVSQNISISHAGFSFEEQKDQWFFTKTGGSSEFVGQVEIEKIGYDLNSQYPAELNRAFFQDDLVNRLYQLVFQKQNTPIVLIGKEGVGKHAIIHEVVWRYQADHYSASTEKKQKIWHINPNRIIAGMSVVGMWEKRFEAILKFVVQPDRYENNEADKVLIDNPIALLRIGKSAQNDLTLSHVLKPYLEKRELQVVILATPEEWKIVQEQDRSFADLFQVLRIHPPSLEKAVKIAIEQRKILELDHDCEINIQAINQLFAIQRNYLKNKPLPGSVLKMMHQLATKYRFKTVDAQEVRDEFKVFSGLQERIFDESTTLETDEVKNSIGQDLVGQPEAVKTLANVIHLIKSKLVNTGKPFGSFLFIGPTGVGKTQAAKVLCKYLMGSEEYLLRFDMNEYIDEGALERLIGDYHNPEGQLTGRVRYRPFGILLLDEIEKAHPKVHDLLLQVLDDGRLTDSLGRTVDFSNTIIIMTSNVGARKVGSQLGFATDSQDDGSIYVKAVENHFRPEFVNRIDQIVIFNSLELDHILNIARLQIKELLQRDGFLRRTTILNISEEALNWVAQRGFDKRMGGRALKRQIERDLTALSAEQLISTYSENPIILDIHFEKDHLVPKISQLDFVEPIENNWVPELPDEAAGRRFYNKLLAKIEQLENKISKTEEITIEEKPEIIVIGDEKGENLDWQYYDFKNKLAEVKERIHTVRLGFRDRYFKEGPAIPLRLKGGGLMPRKDWGTKGMRQNYRDRLFQQEALVEISEAYQYAPAQFDSIKTEFIENYLNVSFLMLFSKGFLKGETDKVNIRFESYISGMGQKEMEYLSDLYCALLEKMEIQYKVSKNKLSISAEGHKLFDFLNVENGIHLFYQAHKNPLPIKFIVEKEGGESTKQLNFNKVIRIYDGSNTLTDLRTGMSNEINISPEEFKLLLYAGLSKETRNKIEIGI